jgi:hypothetical protein
VNRPKFTDAVTVKLDAEDIAAVDKNMREREQASGVPLSRSFVVREILRGVLLPHRVGRAKGAE